MDNPQYEKLLNAGLRFVSYRPRSEKELRDFLLKKSNHEDIENVIDRLRELGYVDDKKFADWWIQQRSAFRPKSRRAIQFELQSKGIAQKIDVDEFAMAQKIMAKKPLLQEKNEVYAFLATRGFSSETIRRVIDGLTKKD